MHVDSSWDACGTLRSVTAAAALGLPSQGLHDSRPQSEMLFPNRDFGLVAFQGPMQLQIEAAVIKSGCRVVKKVNEKGAMPGTRRWSHEACLDALRETNSCLQLRKTTAKCGTKSAHMLKKVEIFKNLKTAVNPSET